MKNTVGILIALVTSMSLQAHARVAPSDAALIQLRMGGGMPAPGGLVGREVTIRESGDVHVHETRYAKDFNGPNEEREYILGRVEPVDVLLIKETVDRLHGGLFLEPQGPQCMDAPSYTYSVVKDSMLIPVYRIFGCRPLELRDESQRSAALEIKGYLDHWLALTHGSFLTAI
ncbi:MAG: hypothetical protein AB7G93_04050 [Bdellovibrionales bacterium]